MSFSPFKSSLENIDSYQDLEQHYSPMTPEEHVCLWQFIEDTFIRYMGSVRHTELNFFKTTYKLNLFYFQYLYPFVLSTYFDSDKNGDDRDSLIIHAVSQLKVPNMFSVQRLNFKTKLSYIKKNILKNISRGIFQNHAHRVMIVSGSDAHIDRYVEKQFPGTLSLLIPAVWWGGKHATKEVYLPEMCRAFCEGYVNELNRYFQENYPVIESFVFEYLQQWMMSYFTQVYQYYQTVKESIQSSRLLKNGSVIVSPIGNPLNKIFCEAYRELGGRVTVFSHGNPVCRPVRNGIVLNEMIHADEYIASSSYEVLAIKYVLKKLEKRHSVFKASNFNIRIFSGDHTTNDQFLGEFRFPIKTLLVAGLPHSDFQHPDLFIGQGLKWLYLELSLLKAFKRHGLNIIYKVHPETKVRDFKVFDRYVDKIEYAPFETCIELGDAIVNMTFGSTTYACSARSSKPFILVETPQIDWDPQMFEKIIPKIMYVGVHVNEHNMYTINQIDVDQICQKLNNQNFLREHIAERKKLFNEI